MFRKFLLYLFITFSCSFLVFTSYTQADQGLQSGKAILVNTPDNLGPLAAHAVLSIPTGIASVFNSQQPDLFVRTGKFGSEPGLFLYPWVASADNGTPVFGARIRVSFPFDGKYPPNGSIFQSADNVIHGVWLQANELVHTTFDKKRSVFIEKNRIQLQGLPRTPRNVVVMPNPDGTVEVVLEISDGVKGRPDDFGGRDPRYRPYDGAGIWRGGLPYVYLYAVTLPFYLHGPSASPRLVSTTEREVQSSYQQITIVNLGTGRERDLVCGSRYGGLHYYHNLAFQGINLESRLHLVHQDGNAIRHPIINPSPVAYPNSKTGLSDLITGGEGGLYYYEFTGSFTETGTPIYKDPRVVLQQDAELYAGTLPVPNVFDWDGDGALDIIAGNSDGKIVFFKNAGTNTAPAYVPGVPLRAGGYEIHIQAGYRMDIQGPGEARWGYTCPTVADWNEDGLPDILLSDCTARHTVYLNRGSRTKPRLDRGRPLYLDGLDMHGTWRVKPAVAKLGNRMAYIALDDDDQFHLYWRIDDYNLQDSGKLLLEDKSVIGANFLHAGGTGRLKLNLVDWDRDGLMDLVVGTPRHGSVPNPENGLPQSLGLPGSAVLFLRNVNTNSKPVFAFPEIMTFQGESIFLGQHSCGPAPAFFTTDAPDLIVGEEDGRILFYGRKDLSHTSPAK